MVGLMPGKAEGPQQRHYLAQIPGALKDQRGIEKHLPEQDHKKGQESVAEPLGTEPCGGRAAAGQVKFAAQQSKELSTPAVGVAVSLASGHQGDDDGDNKTDQSQPGEQNVKKSQNQVSKGGDPEIVGPFFLHAIPPSETARAFMEIMQAGHSFSHLPQPTHKAGSTDA